MSAGGEYVAHLVASIEGSFDQAKRPLVVIDPEDREQVERLRMACRDANALWSRANMQAALRSLLTPPRPPEPRGRYAVVEDDLAVEWCRAELIGVAQWVALAVLDDLGHPMWRNYADIAAVRVLSEGVTE